MISPLELPIIFGMAKIAHTVYENTQKRYDTEHDKSAIPFILGSHLVCSPLGYGINHCLTSKYLPKYSYPIQTCHFYNKHLIAYGKFTIRNAAMFLGASIIYYW